MKILRQTGIILAVCLLGEGAASLLPVPFPGSVAALIILALLLGIKVVKERQIKETADFMLSNMAIVFVPASLGIMEDISLLKGQLPGFLVVVGLSLILTFLGTYATVRAVQKIMGRRKHNG